MRADEGAPWVPATTPTPGNLGERLRVSLVCWLPLRVALLMFAIRARRLKGMLFVFASNLNTLEHGGEVALGGVIGW